MEEIISSRQNIQIKKIRGLLQKKNRQKEDAFLLNGTKLFMEAFTWGVTITHIFLTTHYIEQTDDKVKQTIEKVRSSGVLYQSVSESVLKSLTSEQNPEGIIVRAKKVKLNKNFFSNCVILDNIRDPGNMGTIIRTVDAAGFDAIICSECCVDIYNEKVLRAAMGSNFHFPIFQTQNVLQEIDKLKKQGYFIIGTSLDGIETLGENLSVPNQKVIIIFGSESHGISPVVEAQCDFLWKLPIWGNAESLNVAVSAGIMMYLLKEKLNN
ncbi:MAG: RNA methyltransferase [Eubacteriaceae bacterium]|nr:RNA methyltransferase [Eubacteriaceae bacterium]